MAELQNILRHQEKLITDLDNWLNTRRRLDFDDWMSDDMSFGESSDEMSDW